MQSNSFRIGFPNLVCAKPILFLLQTKLKDNSFFNFNFESELIAPNYSFDLALVSPFIYAKYFSNYKVVPNICISTFQNSKLIRLYFKEGLGFIEKLSINPNYISETIITSIIFSEQYGITPKIIPTISNSLETMFEKSDCAIIIDENLDENFQKKFIDLSEFWMDIFEYPLINKVLICSEKFAESDEIKIISNLGDEAKSFIKNLGDEKEANYLSNFNYNLGESEVEAIQEFFRICFYYKFLNDIPDLHFC